uniref:(northern house mosquito) hypothetical protein n=1 Tax=Culex pipiens TaxID=7175 RepID=A0A8D8NET0_CULPI
MSDGSAYGLPKATSQARQRRNTPRYSSPLSEATGNRRPVLYTFCYRSESGASASAADIQRLCPASGDKPGASAGSAGRSGGGRCAPKSPAGTGPTGWPAG